MYSISDYINNSYIKESAAWLNQTSATNSDDNISTHKLSGYAEKALAAAEKEAGDKWDSVKDKYTKTLTAVDTVVTGGLKQTVSDALKLTGVGMDTLVQKLADMTMNLQMFGDKVGQNVTAYIEDTSGNSTKQLVPIVSLMMSALEANKTGMKPTDMVTLINAVSKK